MVVVGAAAVVAVEVDWAAVTLDGGVVAPVVSSPPHPPTTTANTTMPTVRLITDRVHREDGPEPGSNGSICRPVPAARNHSGLPGTSPGTGSRFEIEMAANAATTERPGRCGLRPGPIPGGDVPTPRDLPSRL